MKKCNSLFSLFSLTLILISTLSISVRAQGILTPPGAPAPSMKTLSQIEPRTPITSLPFEITNRGAYYLTQSLTGTNGILVSTNDVDIDLNGFTLVGPTNPVMGISFYSTTNVTIRNGSLRNWKDVALIGHGISNLRLESLDLSDNNTAISLGGAAIIRNCMISRCISGIFADEGTVVENCIVKNITTTGISVSDGMVLNCTASDNGQSGIFGVRTIVRNCTAARNGTSGIYINGEGSIVDCRSALNDGPGIQVAGGCIVARNHVANNGYSGAIVAGIHATGSNNRIQENQIFGQSYAVRTLLGGNVIIQNTIRSTSTTNFFLSGNNMVAPLITTNTFASMTNALSNFQMQ